jgi:hypothetical protein
MGLDGNFGDGELRGHSELGEEEGDDAADL